MSNTNYPSRLSRCPIIEMSLDIMCTFNFPSDAVIGIVYSTIQNSNSLGEIKLQKLPICNIPIDIRRNDPNLKNRPTHQISCDGGLVMIGENIISLGIILPYSSWNVSRLFINKIISILKEGRIINNISSSNIRYLNFFKLNIFEKINLSISLSGTPMLFPSTVFKTEIPSKEKKDVVSVLQITDGVRLTNNTLGIDANGSLIDIRVVSNDISIDNIEIKIEDIHIEAKSLFFDLLHDDFIATLQ